MFEMHIIVWNPEKSTYSMQKHQEYFLQEQYKDYTIQVHALKSSARIVGALKLSQMAEEEETEGIYLLHPNDVRDSREH